MAKDVKFNIKLNIDGKEQIVTASTNTQGLAKSLGIAKTESDKLRDSLVTLTAKRQLYAKMIYYETQQRSLNMRLAENEMKLQEQREKFNEYKGTGASEYTTVTSQSITGTTSSTVKNSVWAQYEKDIKKLEDEAAGLGAELDKVDAKAKETAEDMKELSPGTTKPPTPTTTTTQTPDVGNIDPGVYNNLQDYVDKLADLQKQRMQATKEQLANVDEEIKAIEAERDVFLRLTKTEVESIEEYKPAAIDKLNTLNDLSDAIRYYQDQQGKQVILYLSMMLCASGSMRMLYSFPVLLRLYSKRLFTMLSGVSFDKLQMLIPIK